MIGMNKYHQCSLLIELLNKRHLNNLHLKLCIAGKLYLFIVACKYTLYSRSKPVLPVEMASSSEQPEIKGTSEQEGKHSNILCIVDQELHSDQVSSEDQTSIDWDTDYIVQHATLMGQIREKISAKAMANITIAQRTTCTMIRGMQIQR